MRQAARSTTRSSVSTAVHLVPENKKGSEKLSELITQRFQTWYRVGPLWSLHLGCSDPTDFWKGLADSLAFVATLQLAVSFCSVGLTNLIHSVKDHKEQSRPPVLVYKIHCHRPAKDPTIF